MMTIRNGPLRVAEQIMLSKAQLGEIVEFTGEVVYLKQYRLCCAQRKRETDRRSLKTVQISLEQGSADRGRILAFDSQTLDKILAPRVALVKIGAPLIFSAA
jgi:hypothetical protein